MRPIRWNNGNCFRYLTPVSRDRGGIRSYSGTKFRCTREGTQNRVNSGTIFRISLIWLGHPSGRSRMAIAYALI